MNYTRDEENIYFLNDKNIATSLDENGINLIPSLSGVSAEVWRIDSDIETTNGRITNLSGELEETSAFLNTNIGNLSNEVNETSSSLKNDVDQKIYTQIGDDTQISSKSLTIHKISKSKYVDLIKTGNIISSDIYIVDANNVDGYGYPVINVGDGTKDLDAINVRQANSISSALSSEITNTNTSLDSLATKTSKMDEYISGRVDAISAALSNEVNASYVHKSGDVINGKLGVTGETSISGNIIATGSTVSLGKGIVKAAPGSFVWNGVAKENYESPSTYAGTFNVNPTLGLNGFYVGSSSLSDLIHTNLEATSSQVETDIGKAKKAVEDSLQLSVETILDIGYLISNDFNLEYDKSEKKIELTAGNKKVSIPTNDFVKDGMIHEVSLHKIDGKQTLSVVFNSDEGYRSITLDVNDLVDVYTASNNGIKLNSNKFELDFDVVAKKPDLDANITLANSNKSRIETCETTISKHTEQINYLSSSIDGAVEKEKDDIAGVNASITTNRTELDAEDKRLDERINSTNSALDSAKDSLQQYADSKANDVTNKVIELDTKVEGYNSSLNSTITSNHSNLNTKIESTKAAIEKTVSDNKAAIELQLTQKENELNGKISANQTNIASNLEKINSLTTKTDDLTNSLNTTVTGLSEANSLIASHETVNAEARTRLNTFDDRITENTGIINTQTIRLNEAESTLSNHTTQINSLNGMMTTAKSDIASLKSRATTLETNVGTNTTNIATLNTKVGTNTTDIASLQSNQTNLKNNLEDLIGRVELVEAYETRIAKLEELIEDLTSRLEAIEESDEDSEEPSETP